MDVPEGEEKDSPAGGEDNQMVSFLRQELAGRDKQLVRWTPKTRQLANRESGS